MRASTSKYSEFIKSSDHTDIYIFPRYTSNSKTTLRTWTLFSSPKKLSDFFDMQVIMNQHINACIETSEDNIIISDLGFIHPKRLLNSIIIGRSHKEFLYIDMGDNESIWILFTESMSVQKTAKNFSDWMHNSQTESSYVHELLNSLDQCSSGSRKRVKRKEFS
ncbi:hypothetical protein PQO03_16725 [Lentisphaera profundi]|uniref:Uncharacterized protein n=1 Tax=Lentisphaera profundi TaxID=1658616 RepID=A0ABY7VTF6_9BACT|nr:hypothetical protein [Lentisphaera profundi]WDE97473.1 hypothetical protein PQO03_16725 [Lentisphaera profundi]